MKMKIRNLCFGGIAGFVLFWVSLCMSCTTVKANDPTIIGLMAKTVSNGIQVTFNEIPIETNRVFITVSAINENMPNDGIMAFTDFRGEQLEQIKNSQTFVCPFVQSGKEYLITAILSQDSEQDIWIDSTATAGWGIRPSNSPILDISSELTVATLSEEPIFPIEVQYAPQRYAYQITILKDNTSSFGYSERTSDLIFNISAMREVFEKDGIEITGLPAYINAFSNLVYDNITWAVRIAESEKFTVNL
jgi:hypothetical protein